MRKLEQLTFQKKVDGTEEKTRNATRITAVVDLTLVSSWVAQKQTLNGI